VTDTLEDRVRREALAQFLEGEEEGALDLLAVARAMAEPNSLVPRYGHKYLAGVGGANPLQG
jgi:hypothetical protein